MFYHFTTKFVWYEEFPMIEALMQKAQKHKQKILE